MLILCKGHTLSEPLKKCVALTRLYMVHTSTGTLHISTIQSVTELVKQNINHDMNICLLPTNKKSKPPQTYVCFLNCILKSYVRLGFLL